MNISVMVPGMLTTLQDGGRKGYQASGFSVSGKRLFCIRLYGQGIHADCQYARQ